MPRSLVFEAVERYVNEVITRETPVQKRLRAETAALPRARMQIGADHGALMAFLAHLIGARWALEIGTFTGYSALAVAAALPADGQLITCDVSEDWTRIARRYWEEAGLSSRIELRLGPATASLAALLRERGQDSFDFAFIDADKVNYDAYYEYALRLVRRGGLIAIDNVLWSGKVADPTDQTEDTVAIRAINAKIHGDSRVDATLVPISDGLTLALKDRKSTRLNSSHSGESRMPSSA